MSRLLRISDRYSVQDYERGMAMLCLVDCVGRYQRSDSVRMTAYGIVYGNLLFVVLLVGIREDRLEYGRSTK